MPASLISSQLTNILNRNNNSVSKAMKKLASGSKINQASDNPAGLIISNLLKSQISGTQRAIQNTQETSNMLDIAEGSLSQMNNILTKMKQLALHAANGGVTSSSQVSADQAEIDSAIRSLDSIARTTAYSDEKLLNGSKQISYSANVQVKNSMDMPMLDAGLTDIQQIFKRDGAHLDITFSGADASGNDNGNAAKKGYFEVTTATPGAEGTQVNDGSQGANAYTLTHDQSFTVTGNAGSYALDFAKGTHLGDVASAINNVSGSTGVKATLIFDSNASGTELSAAAQSTDWAASGRAGDFGAAGATDETKIRAFNKTANGENAISTGVSSVSLTANGAKALEVGVNLDGDGRMYLKMLNNNQYELYKDEAMTMKVGSGSIAADDTPSTVTAANNSGINGMSLQFHDSANFKAGSTAVLQFNNMLADDNASDGYDTANSVSFKGLADSLNPSLGGANMSDSFLSGVKLGYNTSDTGKLYVKATIDYASGEANSQFKIYKDAQMRDEDLVAASAKFNAADINNQASGINVFATKIGDTGQDTGLYGVINLGAYDGAAAGDKVEVNGAEIAFDNLGLRVSSAEYGSDQFVKIHANEGAIWSHYDNSNNAVLLNGGGSGSEWTSYGSDARLSINGQEVTLNGLSGTLSNLDATGQISFRQGSVGNATIATVGYDEGSIAAKAHALGDTSNKALNALHSTTETVSAFGGGMQLQLGEGSGNQNRATYSLQDITTTSLGKTKFNDYFGNAFKTDKYLAINDLMSGGAASLAKDPGKALAIINEAIKDVSSMRANIGAYQANTLESNASFLAIALENIHATESAISDTDIAQAVTEQTTASIRMQAGILSVQKLNQNAGRYLKLLGINPQN